jgi:glycosyltransferase involved in cell wall biosynthesis
MITPSVNPKNSASTAMSELDFEPEQALSSHAQGLRKISILIPVYNEASSLEILLAMVEAVDFCGLEKELVIVDDGSEDGTREILRRLEALQKPQYRIAYHSQNMGKGAALRTAIEIASGDLMAVQDADLEYNPRDYPPLVQMILDERADAVYGSRISSGESKEAFTGLHYLGNKLLTLVTNLLYKTRITDMETCYKVFRSDVIKTIKIRSNRFDFEPEITAKLLKSGARLSELPISYQGRAFHEGKKITWVDGLWALKALFIFRFID